MSNKIEKLNTFVSSIRKKHGEESIQLLSDKSKKQVPVIDSGSLALNDALGVGGYPRGRIIEIYGQEASGKTTLSLLAMAQVQKENGTILFVDAEYALNPQYAKTLGVDIDYEGIAIVQPEYAEQAFDIIIDAAKSGAVDLIVVDSVAALAPKAEIAGDIEDIQVGLLARVMSKALRHLAAVASKTNTTVIFINQIREKVGTLFGNPETTPGGRALKFFSSVRLEVKKGEPIKEGGTQIGHKIKVKVTKNKLAPPYKTAEIELIYEKGVDRLSELFDLGVKYNVIKRGGSWYSYKGTQLGQGKKQAIDFLKENPDIVEEIKKDIFNAGERT